MKISKTKKTLLLALALTVTAGAVLADQLQGIGASRFIADAPLAVSQIEPMIVHVAIPAAIANGVAYTVSCVIATNRDGKAAKKVRGAWEATHYYYDAKNRIFRAFNGGRGKVTTDKNGRTDLVFDIPAGVPEFFQEGFGNGEVTTWYTVALTGTSAKKVDLVQFSCAADPAG